MSEMTRTRPHTARTRLCPAFAAALFLLAPAATAQETPPPPPPAPAAPPGWLGIWIHCDSCEIPRGDRVSEWLFRDLPVIVGVLDGSPARAAGLQVGDTILRINGFALTSPEGGRRFGAIRKGEAATFIVRRNGAERAIRVVPGRRPERVEEMQKPVPYVKKMDSLRPLVQAHLDSILPRLRAQLDSFHVRWRVEGMLHDSVARTLAERQRWMTLYRDSIRIQLDSLAIHVLPMPQVAPQPPGAPYAYRFQFGDSTAVAVGWNAVAGAQMTSLGDELGEYFPGTDGGVLVLKVADGTPAARAGLKPGDVILSVRGERVRTVEDVRKALKPYPQPVQCEVVRKGQKVKVTIQGRERRPGGG